MPNISNNKIENLECMTRKENLIYSKRKKQKEYC